MCYVCCKEFKGWCKSFTRIEGLLSILEAVLLVVLISFLVFLILHLVACRKHPDIDITETTTATAVDEITRNIPLEETTTTAARIDVITTTVSPDVECTWEPSRQTSAGTHYYLSDIPNAQDQTMILMSKYTKENFTTTENLEIFTESLGTSHEYDDVEFLENSDGEDAEDKYKSQVVALVKFKPPDDVTFGCILTKITRFWTLTAASCIEAIEEVDSLDSFIILEDFGDARQSRARTVADVLLHPQFAGRSGAAGRPGRPGRAGRAGRPGRSRRHDLAALRSDRALRGRAPLLRLPTALDYFLIALGERFLILGYGGYRTVDSSPTGRRLRQVSVYAVAGGMCGAGGGGGGGEWAPRHLVRAEAASARGGAAGARGGEAPLCAGARGARAAPCHYCAGAPLLRAGTLLGLMSDNSACGVSCEPQLYVNIGAMRDWIDSVID